MEGMLLGLEGLLDAPIGTKINFLSSSKPHPTRSVYWEKVESDWWADEKNTRELRTSRELVRDVVSRKVLKWGLGWSSEEVVP